MAGRATFDHGRSITIGSVFGRSVNVIKANPVATLGTSFVLMGLPSLLLQQLGTGGGVFEDIQMGKYAFVGVYAIIVALAWMIASGALVQATIAHDQGRKADLSEVLRVGVQRCLPLTAVYILFTIGAMIGLMLLFVPGIILSVIWSVSLPAIVAERTGIFGAFGRSRALTKGIRWQVFGILLLAFVIYSLASATVGVASIAGAGSLEAITSGAEVARRVPLAAQLFSAVVTSVAVGWFTTVGAALFVELRHWKDGPDADRLADIFA